MIKLIIVNRYNTKKVDQEFMDLEMARLDQERENELQWMKEEITNQILK